MRIQTIRVALLATICVLAPISANVEATSHLDIPPNTWVKVNASGGPVWRHWTWLRYVDATGSFAYYGSDPSDNSVIYSNALYFYDVARNRWTREPNPHYAADRCNLTATPSHPSNRHPYGYGAYDPIERVLVQFSGVICGVVPLDTWEYSVRTNTWQQTTPSPSPPDPGFNFIGTLVYDPVSRTHVRVRSNEARWRYNAATNAWRQVAQPSLQPQSGRYEPYSVLDEASGKIVYFGGSLGGSLADTWTYDIASNTWTDMNPPLEPPARRWPAMAYDPDNRVVLMYGGSVDDTQSSDFDDTWVYDVRKNEWTRVSPAASPGIAGMMGPYDTLAYDRQNRIFGLYTINGMYLFRYQPGGQRAGHNTAGPEQRPARRHTAAGLVGEWRAFGFPVPPVGR